jgi:hypothetical protein
MIKLSALHVPRPGTGVGRKGQAFGITVSNLISGKNKFLEFYPIGVFAYEFFDYAQPVSFTDLPHGSSITSQPSWIHLL